MFDSFFSFYVYVTIRCLCVLKILALSPRFNLLSFASVILSG